VESNSNILILKYLHECPDYWQNFINYINPGCLLSESEFHVILQEYGIVSYITDANMELGWGNKVQFESEDVLLQFKLMWS
jgi:hypothetical protein